jgi:peptide/nickel transport system substrate-binding protein
MGFCSHPKESIRGRERIQARPCRLLCANGPLLHSVTIQFVRPMPVVKEMVSMTHSGNREMVVLTQELLEGNIGRREFLQRMLALGVSMSAAVGLLESLTWSDALAAPAEAPKRGGTLRIAYTDEIPALDPHKSPSESSIRFFFLIHATLLKLDKHLKPVGDLAQSFKVSNGGRRYTFTLRPNLKFSNGWALTSADVKATFERILDPKTVAIASSFFANITKIHTPNPHTVVFDLSAPNAALSAYLTSMNSAILPARLLNSGADVSKINNAIGAGPFKVTKWVPDSFMTLSRNTHFHESGKPYVDHVKVTIQPNTSSLLASMRQNSTDFTYSLDAIVGKEAAAAHSLKVMRVPDLSYYLLFLQTARDPFLKKDTRQAVSYAIDRHAIIAAANLGEGVPVGPVAAGLGRYAYPTSKLPGYKRDVKKAKQLLAKAGQSQGFKFTLLTQKTDPDNAPAIAQVVQSQLGDVGITADVQLMEFSAWVQDWLKADYQMMPGNNGGGPDPDYYLYRYFYSGGNLNFVTGHWKSAQMDAQLLKARSSNNFKVRKAAYDKAQQILVDASPFIWLYSGFLYSIMQSKVQGFIPRANHSLVGLRDVWLS